MLAGSILYPELNIYYYIISGVGIIPTPELLPMEETWKGTFLKMALQRNKERKLSKRKRRLSSSVLGV